MPAIPECPTRQDAERSLVCLEALLREFPFEAPTDRSVATSMLMTPVLRAALGVVPIHVVSAPDPGTGKSYLNDLSSAICIGERCPVKSVAPKEEETEKRLIGAALAGHPIIALDNCNGVLSGDFLAQISERQVLDLRGLGASTMFRINNTFTCFANGNNIIIYGDLTRRCVRVRLDADIEDPTSRTFKGNPVAAILADRGKYIAAVLTIALAYIAAGRPSPPHAVPSYERWSDLVCGALVWLQRPNPADSMAGLRAENPAGSDLATVLRAWPPHHLAGATTAELIDTAHTFDTKGLGKPLYPDWLAAIRPVAQNKVGQLDGLIFGKWLGANRDRMIGRRKLCRIGSDTRPKWKIEEDIPATATNAAPF
jgi:putative DNA primase/helicase